MALMQTPCGETMEISKWVQHIPKCQHCAIWWMTQKGRTNA